MEILSGAVAIVGAVAVLNLLLTFGVIRRLREHTALLADGAVAPRGLPTMIEVGESIAPFTATAVDGSLVSLDRFAGPTLVGVFGVGCTTCEEKLPVFVEHAVGFPGGPRSVLALVSPSDEAPAAPYVEALAEIAVVVREDPHGPVSTALGITGYPAFALVEAGGVVVATAADPSRLPAPDLAGLH